MALPNQNVCSFNKYGFCKFRLACRKQHIMENCPNNKNCEIEHCSLRHPRTCRYYRDIGYCKFGEWCLFNHDESSNSMTDIQKITKKLYLTMMNHQTLLKIFKRLPRSFIQP